MNEQYCSCTFLQLYSMQVHQAILWGASAVILLSKGVQAVDQVSCSLEYLLILQ